MALKQSLMDGAAKGNPYLLEILHSIATWQLRVERLIGVAPTDQKNAISSPPPPIVKDLQVDGQLGNFIATVTLAPDVNGSVLYKFQSSQTLPFETSTTLEEYITPAAILTVTQPSETRYWRVASKYSGSDYGSFFVTGPASSGTP